MKKIPIINWYPFASYTQGLRDLFSLKTEEDVFSTVRLGSKWADKLNPGDKVAISVWTKPLKSKVIGHTVILSITKKLLYDLEDNDLIFNIGAKTANQAGVDMAEVYGRAIDPFETISILQMKALK